MEERLTNPSDLITSPAIPNVILDSNTLSSINKFDSLQIANVAQNGLDIVESIRNTQLLTSEDAKNIQKAHDFLVSSYTDVIIYNTRIAKVSSILSDGKFPTNDSKFWQCKMQAEVHFNEFIRALYKLDRVKIDIEEIQYQLLCLTSMLEQKDTNMNQMDSMKLSFDKRRLINKLNQYVHEMKLLEKDIKQRLREINDWAEIADGFKDACIHSTSKYEEHTINNHVLALQNFVNGSKNPEEKKNYMDQLNTFLRLLGKPPIK
jgi:predicted transcriptional regulator